MAGKIDKKLAKKLAKMTEEERRIFLEEQRKAEEENKRKREEMLSRFLKGKTEKEQKSSQINQLKLQSKWRDIMRQVKSVELKKEIEILNQTFERIIDKKNAIIQSLLRDIEEAEQQYDRALQSHLENVNSLIDFQLRRIQELQDTFQEEVDMLIKTFDEERSQKIRQHEQDMQDLRDIRYAMELRDDEHKSDILLEFQGLVDEIKNKNLEERHALKKQREGQIDELWQEFHMETEQYRKNTQDQKKRFEELKKKDEDSSKEIDRQQKRIQKLQTSINQVKTKLSSGSRDFEEKSSQIKENKDVVTKRFRELKEEMIKSRDSERAKLTTLTVQSNAATKELEKLKEQGEAILRLAEICRKYETEEEKVLPFYPSAMEKEEEDTSRGMEENPPSQELAEVMLEYKPLENFWKRYNKVMLDKLALDKERQSLQSENQQLKGLLKQYLDGISVNDDILSQTNPLLVVNQRTQVQLPTIPVGDRRVKRKEGATVVEAAHIVKHIL